MYTVGKHTISVKHGREKYILTTPMCLEFVYDVMKCAMNKTGIRDGESAKYTASHFKKMLL